MGGSCKLETKRGRLDSFYFEDRSSRLPFETATSTRARRINSLWESSRLTEIEWSRNGSLQNHNLETLRNLVSSRKPLIYPSPISSLISSALLTQHVTLLLSESSYDLFQRNHDQSMITNNYRIPPLSPPSDILIEIGHHSVPSNLPPSLSTVLTISRE